MREVCGSVERIDIPTVFVIEARSSSLFTKDAVVRKNFVQALNDEFFRRAVSLGDEIDIALVFGGDAPPLKITQQRAGFFGNLRGCGSKDKIGLCGHDGSSASLRAPLRSPSRSAAWADGLPFLRRRGSSLLRAISVMVRI